MCPQFGHSNLVPPSGNSGFGGWKKFATPERGLCSMQEQSGSVLSGAKANAVFHGPPSSVELCRDRDGTLDATVRQLQFPLHALHDGVQAELTNQGIYAQEGNKERWRMLSEQASVEQDPNKLQELITEINDLMEAREARLKGSPSET